MDDCNTCSCDESGTLARCTAMACDPNERHKRADVAATLITTTDLPSKKGNCIPGTRWKQECNWCSCGDNGFAFCTLKGCLGPNWSKQHHHKFHPAQVDVNKVQVDLNKVIDTTSLPETTTPQKITVVEAKRVRRAYSSKSAGSGSGDDNISTTDENQNQQTTRSPSSMYLKTWRKSTTKPIIQETTEKQEGNKEHKHSGKPNMGLTTTTPSTDFAYPNGTQPSNKPTSPVVVTDITEATTTSKQHDFQTSELVFTEEEFGAPGFKLTCTPNESFKVACNTCWCSSSGNSARYCTRQACKPKTYPTLPPQ